MRRLRWLLVLAACAPPAMGHAQASPDRSSELLPELNDLRSSGWPAFTVLGVSPSVVQRPLTPGALGLSFLGGVRNFNEVPTDFALEAAPYWFSSHPERTWRDDDRRSLSESLARTFSLSVGTAQLDPVHTGLGAGVSASLLSGRLAPEFVRGMEAIEASLLDRNTRIARFVDAAGRFPTEAELDSLDALARVRVGEVEYRRVGWFLAAAAAGVWTFPDNIARRGQVRGWSGWITLDRETERWAVLGVVRYQDNELVSPDPAADFGVRAQRVGDDYGAGFEVLVRAQDERDPQSRITALLEYRLRENIWLHLALGEDFDDTLADSFIAQLLLNLTFDKKRRVNLGD